MHIWQNEAFNERQKLIRSTPGKVSRVWIVIGVMAFFVICLLAGLLYEWR